MAHWSRHSSMSRHSRRAGVIGAAWFVGLVASWSATSGAQDARTIVAEAQRRSATQSQHYEGLLQVFDAKGTIADKRWILDRIGSHGNSKTVLRFTMPAE